MNDLDDDQQITESIPVVESEPPPAQSTFAPATGIMEQIADPQRPEKAVAAAFAGGLLFARLLRRIRS